MPRRQNPMVLKTGKVLLLDPQTLSAAEMERSLSSLLGLSHATIPKFLLEISSLFRRSSFHLTLEIRLHSSWSLNPTTSCLKKQSAEFCALGQCHPSIQNLHDGETVFSPAYLLSAKHVGLRTSCSNQTFFRTRIDFAEKKKVLKTDTLFTYFLETDRQLFKFNSFKKKFK